MQDVRWRNDREAPSWKLLQRLAEASIYRGCVVKPSIEPLFKEIHDAEREIDAIEWKIQFADLKKTYPHEYAAMRSEQENHRQQILHCKASLDNHVKAEHVEDPRPFDIE
jgi:hypothetical protein